jgi:hypothetical protein
MMLKLTASINGNWLWVNPASIDAFRHPVPAELKGDEAVNAVLFMGDIQLHVRNTPEEIAAALEKL